MKKKIKRMHKRAVYLSPDIFLPNDIKVRDFKTTLEIRFIFKKKKEFVWR